MEDTIISDEHTRVIKIDDCIIDQRKFDTMMKELV